MIVRTLTRKLDSRYREKVTVHKENGKRTLTMVFSTNGVYDYALFDLLPSQCNTELIKLITEGYAEVIRE